MPSGWGLPVWLALGLAVAVAILRLGFARRGVRRLWRRHRFRCRQRLAPPAAGKRFRPVPPRRAGGRAKPVWVREALLELYAEGHVGCRKLADTFNRLYAPAGMTVGKTWVSEVLIRYRYQAAEVRRATRNRMPRPMPANHRWGLDGTGKADGSGRVHAILGIVDHGTRLNLALAPLANANACTILGHLFLAIGRFGKPRRIRTDNAAVFHGRLFQAVLKAVGIRHEFTGLGMPWQNGRIERFFLTLKEKLNQIVPTDAAALGSLLTEFSFWYNVTRPHQHLYGLTPWEAWTGTDPYRRPPVAVERFSAWDDRLRGLVLRR